MIILALTRTLELVCKHASATPARKRCLLTLSTTFLLALGKICEAGKCRIGCANGLQGDENEYQCVNGTLSGELPTCRNVTCDGNSTQARALLTAHTTSNCGPMQVGDNCTAHCKDGYGGVSQDYTCQDGGIFAGEAMMNCTPYPCNASHQPANGNNGACTDQLASGSSCLIECDLNYTRHGGATSCLAGTLVNVSTCKPDPCDASEPPAHGTVGDCTDSLPSGATCTPVCNDGYYPVGTTSCYAGTLTASYCEYTCKCELIYLKQCIDQYGYWSEETRHLDYPGCESFCNEMNLAEGITIYGCELEDVPSAARTTEGKWCFAHLNECNYGEELENNAAAKCVHFTSQGH